MEGKTQNSKEKGTTVTYNTLIGDFEKQYIG